MKRWMTLSSKSHILTYILALRLVNSVGMLSIGFLISRISIDIAWLKIILLIVSIATSIKI
jgi:hypothetical protein